LVIDFSANLTDEVRSIYSRLRHHIEEYYSHVRSSLHTVHQLLDAVSGLPGRKAVLYLSAGLSMRPGHALIEGFAQHLELLPGTITEITAPEIEAARYDATDDLQELVAHANAGGVAFYTVDASPTITPERGSSAAATSFWNREMSSLEESNRQKSLQLMADGTAGRVALNGSSLETLLRGIRSDFETYYALGYIADSLPEGEKRKIRVEVVGTDLQAHHRTGLVEKSVESQLEDRTLAALLNGRVENPLDVSAATGRPTRQDDGRFLVPLLVTVPLEELVLLPIQDEHLAEVSLFVAARDERGRTSQVNKHLCPVRIPNSEVLLALGRTAACRVSLLMRPGFQTVAVSVRDEIAAVDSTVNLALEVPPEKEQALLR
jgi:hypothetical protein